MKWRGMLTASASLSRRVRGFVLDGGEGGSLCGDEDE